MATTDPTFRPAALARHNHDQIIYLIRHGETEWNVKGHRQGHSDSPLTPKGIQQAKDIGAWLRQNVPDLGDIPVHASPLGRVRATLDNIFDGAGLSPGAIHFTDLLAEVAFGSVEGLSAEQIDIQFPGENDRHRADRWGHGFPRGESLSEAATRARRWYNGIAHIPELIVVSHGGLGRALRGLYLNLSVAEIIALKEPQDALFRLTQGAATRFDV